MSIGNEIAAANGGAALPPEQTALVIFRQLFETGPTRMPDRSKFVALASMTAGLIEWKKQILAETKSEEEKWKRAYKDAKMELDELKLRIAILEKEGKL